MAWHFWVDVTKTVNKQKSKLCLLISSSEDDVFCSPHDVQLGAMFITGALQWSFLQVPTAAATTFICKDSRTPAQNKNMDYV